MCIHINNFPESPVRARVRPVLFDVFLPFLGIFFLLIFYMEEEDLAMGIGEARRVLFLCVWRRPGFCVRIVDKRLSDDVWWANRLTY